jgi:YHS domain-containing protein
MTDIFSPKALTLLLLVGGAALFATPAGAIDPINTTLFGNKAIEGYDPVAYFTQSKAVKGKKSIAHEWKGATWLFASEENKAKFVAEPEKYAPRYGGYCAYAVSQGSTAGIDPEAFTVVDGKLYLNYSQKIQQQWEDDREKYIRDADTNWPGILADQ